MSEPMIIKINSEQGYQRLLGGSPDTSGMKSGKVSLKINESVGEHSTDNKEEAIIILQGEAEISCAGKNPMTAAEGALIYIPPHTRHDVKNIGKDTLNYVYIVAPVEQHKQ